MNNVITLHAVGFDGTTAQHGFHLGTDLRVAKEIAIDMWLANLGNLQKYQLMRNGKVVAEVTL